MSDTPKQQPENTPNEQMESTDKKEPLLDSGGETTVGPAPREPAENAGPPKNKGKRGKGVSVFSYLTILFAAAFFMLLMAYFMQQRNNEVAMSGLRDSISQFQSLDDLRNENEQQLQERLLALEEENATLQEENEALNQQYVNVSNWYNRAQTESDLRGTLYTAEYLYEAGDYQTAAACLSTVNGDDLLIISTTSSYGVPSDSQRYETLKEALIETGHLTEDPNSGQLQVTAPET